MRKKVSYNSVVKSGKESRGRRTGKKKEGKGKGGEKSKILQGIISLSGRIARKSWTSAHVFAFSRHVFASSRHDRRNFGKSRASFGFSRRLVKGRGGKDEEEEEKEGKKAGKKARKRRRGRDEGKKKGRKKDEDFSRRVFAAREGKARKNARKVSFSRNPQRRPETPFFRENEETEGEDTESAQFLDFSRACVGRGRK